MEYYVSTVVLQQKMSITNATMLTAVNYNYTFLSMHRLAQ